MPTSSDPGSGAEQEAAWWIGFARRWVKQLPAELPPSEAAVVRFYDPGEDLQRRAGRWGYQLGLADLSDLARFAAALARAEARAWADDEPHIATRALEDRRFLVGDRILHWAVPYLDAIGRCYPEMREHAHADRDDLLQLGDTMRPAPALVGREGMSVPGEDTFGPLDRRSPLPEHLLSVWSGLVVLGATLRSMRGMPLKERRVEETWLEDPRFRADLTTLYELAGLRWTRLAESHSGTARLWVDLSDRAQATAVLLAQLPGSC
jgi:hypothetical protein